jgi:hypothetical protein
MCTFRRDGTAAAAICDSSITAINAEQLQQPCMTEIHPSMHKFVACDLATFNALQHLRGSR